jgi:predicted GNAT family acetyltransferase
VPESPVLVERLADAQAFLDAAGPFLADREAEHNLLFGIAANLIADPDRPMTAPPYFAAVRREDEVVAAALMTPPFNVVLSCSDDPDAVPALAADLDRGRIPVPGITAPVDVARSFSERWAERHGVTAERTMAERIYRVERVTRPHDVPGSIRIATPDDRDLLVAWVRDFLREAVHRTDDRETQAVVDSALRTGSRTFYLWEHEGRPVSLAGVTGPTPNGIRVGPVYTPPSDREHGFASAVTAAASQEQLDRGRRFVFLNTDISNPTSNKIYQAIGYEPVIDIDQWSFEPA